jgi:hypothetical protein
VLSSATPTGTQAINVKTWNGSLYAVKTSNFTFSGNATANLAVQVTNIADGAFNVLDVMTSGFQFLNVYAAGATNLNSLALNAFWQNDVSNGTFYCPNGTSPDPNYCPGGAGISVFSDPSGSGDTDEFDDDVLFHEFGHFTADNFSKDDSMGGPHYLNENDYDMRLTWSEGWGNFFQGAVKFWLNSTDPSLISSKAGVPLSQYVDTVSGQDPLIVDVADPDNIGGGSPYCFYYSINYCTYSTNEISVANVLWNHLTGIGSYGMQPVWNVIAGFKSSISVINLEAFYDGWRSLYGDPTAAIYKNRLIDYSDDNNEPDNVYSAVTQTFTVGTMQNRRLYSVAAWPGEDSDFVKFTAITATSYIITTSNLRNGADTYLAVYDSTGSEIPLPLSMQDNTSTTTWVAGTGNSSCTGAQNYDCYNINGWLDAPLNNTTNLASMIIWTAQNSGTYYVKISPSPNRPKSAGKYGSYSLSIISQ